MLPAALRIRQAADFARVLHSGQRGKSGRLITHMHVQPTTTASRAGFIVSKKVGNSVVRHRVTRRLRHLMADQLRNMPAGSDIVVRALPGAGTATSAQLGRWLTGALAQATSGSTVRSRTARLSSKSQKI